MAATRYYDLVREMRDAYNHRLRLVESVRQRGIKPTARLFATSALTVRKWWRRYQQQGLTGLRQHGLIRRRRRKYRRKQDLAAVKATWRLFQQISADTKELGDIPRYWPQAEKLGLPWFQYTAREVRSGLLFLAYADRLSAAASSVFAARVQRHLQRYGIQLRDLVWQTDNGGEFIGRYQGNFRRSGFPAALGDSQHVRIPPAAHTYQSDVETVHRLVEDEFFDLESFTSRGDFLAKAHTYQLYFNLARPNSHKDHLSPWQIIERLAPRSPLELCLLPPVFLDYYINDKGGYDLPRYPYKKKPLVAAVYDRRL